MVKKWRPTTNEAVELKKLYIVHRKTNEPPQSGTVVLELRCTEVDQYSKKCPLVVSMQSTIIDTLISV